ncbi:MAG: peptidase E [Candidatus Moraniibacteriota bacterium]
MRTVVAIGGGELKDLETLTIDRKIVKLSRKKRPKALFLATASNDAAGYRETFEKIYGKKLGCKTDALFLIREKLSQKERERKVLSADLIYVGGGNTLRMLRIWKKYGVDKLLKRAYDKGIILSGLSAGAICWFRYGSSDARRFVKGAKKKISFMRVSGLGLLPCTVSPHHIREKNRERGLAEMMKRTPGVGLAIDDNAALLVQDGKYRVLRSRPETKIEKVFQRNGKIIKYSIPESGLLDTLLEKSG